MLHASTQQLIMKLCELTEGGALAWREGQAGASVFETEGYVIEVRGEPPLVRLLCEDGRELERVDAADLATPWPQGDGTYLSHVARMADHAGRIARGAETAIAMILTSLSAPPRRSVEQDSMPASEASHDRPADLNLTDGSASLPPDGKGLQPSRLAGGDDHSPSPAQSSASPTREDAPGIVTKAAVASVTLLGPEPAPSPELPGEARMTHSSAITHVGEMPLQAQQPEPERAGQSDVGEDLIHFSRRAIEAQDLAALTEPTLHADERGPHQDAGRNENLLAPLAATPVEAAKVTSTGLLIRGFSARTSQIVEPSEGYDYRLQMRPPSIAEPPAKAPEENTANPQSGQNAWDGANIYKPWT